MEALYSDTDKKKNRFKMSILHLSVKNILHFLDHAPPNKPPQGKEQSKWLKNLIEDGRKAEGLSKDLFVHLFHVTLTKQKFLSVRVFNATWNKIHNQELTIPENDWEALQLPDGMPQELM